MWSENKFDNYPGVYLPVAYLFWGVQYERRNNYHQINGRVRDNKH